VVRPATVDDRERALALFRRVFGDVGAAVTPEIWDWLFVDNPAADKLYYVVADARGRLAGQYAAAPVFVQHAGERVRALISLHTATDPEFERQGIFRTLADRLYQDAAADVPVVYGFPNPVSAPVFYSRLDWTELRPFPLVVRPLSGPLGIASSFSSALARRRVRRRFAADDAVVSFDEFGDWADDLWAATSSGLGICAVRDARYLNWRFVRSPYSYRRYAVIRGGAPVAFAVVTFAPWRGGVAAYVMELMARPDDREAARALLGRAISDARDGGAAAVLSIVSPRHPHRAAFVRSGFLPVPNRVRTSFSFGVRRLGAGLDGKDWVTPREWSISGADLDFV
jgi:GNAT superfamily N-acetyltransferase